MASHGSATSPKPGNSTDVATPAANSTLGQCVCSPSTHPGSFRCRFHRSKSSAPWLKRSKSSVSATVNSVDSLSPKSVESV
ncbi:hypothetical protein SLE2022_266920 [Rubroshorea leprosula]